MCGIFGYLGQTDAIDKLYSGICTLQNRGYDSVGMATISSQGIVISKAVNQMNKDCFEEIKDYFPLHQGNHIGIIHSRWLTHGKSNLTNTHPHTDCAKRFAIVHNGIIENYASLRNFLAEKDINCISETDTEVIVQLLSLNVKEANDVLVALEQTLRMLEGTWALAILDEENPDCILACRKGSPLLLGVHNLSQDQKEFFLSSELSAFQKYTKTYLTLDEGEIIKVSQASGLEIYKNGRFCRDYSARLKTNFNGEEFLDSPYPYEHWTLKEIYEQEKVLSNILETYVQNDKVVFPLLEKEKDKLLTTKHLLVIACGSSKNAADFSAPFFRKINKFESVQIIDASEFDMSYINNINNCSVLCVSQSGETQDIIRHLKELKALNIPLFFIVNKADSQITRMCDDIGIYMHARREVGVASTKSFTSSMLILYLLSLWFNNETIDISINNQLKTLFSDEKFLQVCKRTAEKLVDKEHLFILGKGESAAIASEGALKIKEIGYLHAEAFPGGALKHGPFALIEKGTPIIVLLLDNIYRSYMESTICEVKSRDAAVILITDIDLTDNNLLEIIRIPNGGIFSNLFATIALQLIAYNLSVLKGNNPDKPRNLAKVVTVI